MIVYKNENNEFEFPVTFEELRERFPFTSFCIPLHQSALPENYYLCELLLDDALVEFPVEKNKRTDFSEPFEINGKWFYKWEVKEVSENELLEQEDKVDVEVSRLMNKIQWALTGDVPDRVKNKYLEIKKQITQVYDQRGYPFHVKYPEVE